MINFSAKKGVPPECANLRLETAEGLQQLKMGII